MSNYDIDENENANINDQDSIKPAPLETEDSADYDPFKLARKLDNEAIEENKRLLESQDEDGTQGADEGRGEKGSDEPDGQGADDGGEGKYTPEEIAWLEEKARRGIMYDRYFEEQERLRNSDPGNEKAAKAPDGQKAEDEEPDAWGNVSRTVFGPYADEYNKASEARFKKLVQNVIDERLGGVQKEVEFVKQNRIASEMAGIATEFANHWADVYDMTPEEAQKITYLKMQEIAQKHPDFDPDIIRRELESFSDRELSQVNKSIRKKNKDRIAQLEAELAQYKGQGSKPKETSTSVAADRLYNTEDANFKRGGEIPNGRPGNTQAEEDEVEAATRFLRGY